MFAKPFLSYLKTAKKYGYKVVIKLLYPSYSVEELFINVDKLSPIRQEKVATPEVKQMNVAKISQYLQTDEYSLPAIYTVILVNSLYYPRYDLILTDEGKVLKETNHIKFHTLKVNQILDLIKTASINKFRNLFYLSKKISGFCSIIRRSEDVKNNHYHTLVDVIPRCYLLNQAEYNNIDEIKLLFPSEPTTIELFFINKLAPKNIKITVVENPDSLYELDKLIFPTFMSRLACGYLPSVYIEYFQNRILPKRESKKVHRIFISRSKARSRKLLNEKELLDALEPYGFKKYFIEDMSIEEQIDLFYDAEYVIGTHGAGLTNIIFSCQIKVLELFNSEICQTHYYYLAKSLGHTYGYCNCLEQKKAKRSADFRMNISEVIERMLEIEKQHQH